MTTRAEVMQELLDDMEILMVRADVDEACGLVVTIFDPETGITNHYGPFPKDGAEAMIWLERNAADFNALGEGPLLRGKVHLLFRPTR